MNYEKRKKNSDKLLMDSKNITKKGNNEEDAMLDKAIGSMSKAELVHIASSYFKGPLPDPLTMEKYENTCPGAADRIIGMVEDEAKRNYEINREYLRMEARDSLLGIISAFIIAITIIACGTFIIIKVPSTGGIVSGSLLNLIGISTVTGTFLGNTRRKQNGEKETQSSSD